MRQTLIAGNWKLNGSISSIQSLATGIADGLASDCKSQVVVCAPYIYLPLVQSLLDNGNIQWGAQNVSAQSSGAYTGEIATSMLLEFGCSYVIIGHSERRSLYHETDIDVANKFATLKSAGLTPILCVGEQLAERERGQTNEIVGQQVDAVINHVGVSALNSAVIAYEPVWAIGTGKTASPEQAQDVHAFIRERIATHDASVAEKLQIIYGGSMNENNAAQLLAMQDIDGGLIGGASLKTDSFLGICHTVTSS